MWCIFWVHIRAVAQWVALSCNERDSTSFIQLKKQVIADYANLLMLCRDNNNLTFTGMLNRIKMLLN